MTINDSVIKVVSTDDALNATGGNSGMMMPGGNGEGGEFTPPEGFEGGQKNPDDGQTTENGEAQAGKGTRPQRGEFGNMNPNFEMHQNGEFTPPEGVMPENGEFTLPEGTMPEMGTGQMPGGFMGGGMDRNMKECLIINGGYIELYGEDDCLDANGNLTINGGT